MDWNSMSEQAKIEYVGYLEYNRIGCPEWEGRNNYYETQDGLVSIVLDNEDDIEEDEY